MKYRQYDSTVSNSPTVVKPASYVPESAGAGYELSEAVCGVNGTFVFVSWYIVLEYMEEKYVMPSVNGNVAA